MVVTGERDLLLDPGEVVRDLGVHPRVTAHKGDHNSFCSLNTVKGTPANFEHLCIWPL